MDDTTRVQNGINAAVRENREIDHGTARTIAANYHDGKADTYGFVSTGAIPEGIDTGEFWRRFTDDGKLYAMATNEERRFLDCFGTYLLHRRNDRGAVEGWSDMWAPDF